MLILRVERLAAMPEDVRKGRGNIFDEILKRRREKLARQAAASRPATPIQAKVDMNTAALAVAGSIRAKQRKGKS